MEIIKKEGKDLENILAEICEEFNITENDFYYRYNEKKNGLFNKTSIFNVEVILKKEILVYIKEYLEELIKNMGIDANYETKLRDEAICIKIYSSHNPVLIGKGGNTIKALEHLIKQKLNKEFSIYPIVKIDIEDYREKHDRRLERLAKNLAKEVVKTKGEIHLENMNAYDRRVVHNALTNFKGVITSSTGEEPERHVVIKPE